MEEMDAMHSLNLLPSEGFLSYGRTDAKAKLESDPISPSIHFRTHREGDPEGTFSAGDEKNGSNSNFGKSSISLDLFNLSRTKSVIIPSI
jgi:hypothetical protein